MINLDTWAPVIGPTLAFDANLEPTLRGLIIKAPGSLFIEDINGKTANFTFAASDPTATGPTPSCDFPYKLCLQIRKIVGNGAGAAGNGSTGTNIALTNLVPLA